MAIKIKPDESKVGMVLAQPITDAQGRTIMAEGSRLTPVHINRLGRWGVQELHVLDDAEAEGAAADGIADGGGEGAQTDDDSSPSVQIDEDFMREKAAEFKQRFTAVEDNPLMDDLKKTAFKGVVLAGRGKIPGVH